MEISPQWPPASVPWAMSTSTPRSRLRSAWRGEPHSAPTITPLAWAASTAYSGGGPRAFTSIETGCSSASATLDAPTLLLRTSSVLRSMRPRLLLSSMVFAPTVNQPGPVSTTDSALKRPLLSATATTSGLMLLPGSKMSLVARLR